MIKDLRETKLQEAQLKKIEREAFMLAYEEILSENVVMSDVQFKEEIEKAKAEVTETLAEGFAEIGLTESVVKDIEEGTASIYSDKAIKIAEEKMIEKITSDIVEKSSLSEELFQEVFKGTATVISEEDFSKVEEILEAKVEDAKKVGATQVVEELTAVVGDKAIKSIYEAIDSKETLYVMSESDLPMIEEKMIEKLKASDKETPTEIKENAPAVSKDEPKEKMSLAEKLIGSSFEEKEKDVNEKSSLAEKLM
jgi:hypothetical protein